MSSHFGKRAQKRLQDHVTALSVITVTLAVICVGLGIYINTPAQSYRSYMRRGERYYRDLDYENAKLCFQQAISIREKDDDPDPHTYLGYSYAGLADGREDYGEKNAYYGQAIGEIETARGIAPDRTALMLDEAVIYVNKASAESSLDAELAASDLAQARELADAVDTDDESLMERVNDVSEAADSVSERLDAEVSEEDDMGNAEQESAGEENVPGGSEELTADAAGDGLYHIERTTTFDNAQASDGTQLISVNYDLLSLASVPDPNRGMIEDTNHPGIQKAIDALNAETESVSATYIEKNRDSAQSMYESGYYFNSFINENHLTVIRADDRCFSVARDDMTYSGGAHGYTATTGYSYDAATGERLKITDVLKFSDHRELAGILASELLQTEHSKELSDFNSDLPGTILSLMENNESTTGGDLGAVEWYVSENGVTFVFNQYLIASYAAGQFYVELTPEEYPDVVGTAYARTGESYFKKISSYGNETIDGNELQISRHVIDESFFSEVEVTYAGKSVTIEAYGGDIDAYLLVTPSGKSLYLNIYGEDEYEDLYTIDLNADMLSAVAVGAGLFGNIPTDPDYFVAGMWSDLLSTVETVRSYHAGEGGKPEPDSEYYVVTGYGADYVLTLKSDAELDVLDSVQGTSTHKERISAGTEMHIFRTDNESISDCVTSDGRYIRFTVDTSSWPYIVNGTYELESLLDGTRFAG